MAKHRSSVFTVVREAWKEHLRTDGHFTFDAIIGTYFSLTRAEEVAGAAKQSFKDAGVPDGLYRFSVAINTYYDE